MTSAPENALAGGIGDVYPPGFWERKRGWPIGDLPASSGGWVRVERVTVERPIVAPKRHDTDESSSEDSGLGAESAPFTSRLATEVDTKLNTSLAAVIDTIAPDSGIPELPQGKPGAIVQGHGREIRGRLNLVRFRGALHPQDVPLSNFAASEKIQFGEGLSYLVQTLNQQTPIKTNIVGNVTIRDAASFDAPILFMEAVAPSAYQFTPEEIQRLRAYVLNRGGFLYLATDGGSAYRLLRHILPEYQPAPIPEEHPIYNAYYPLNSPQRNHVEALRDTTLDSGPRVQLEGIRIDGRIAVLVDTEGMMRAIDGGIQRPYMVRQLINIIVYSITHGNISDYRKYVP